MRTVPYQYAIMRNVCKANADKLSTSLNEFRKAINKDRDNIPYLVSKNVSNDALTLTLSLESYQVLKMMMLGDNLGPEFGDPNE